MAVRAIRGATRISTDDHREMSEAVQELLDALMEANSLDADDLISVFFTATPDLHSAFPARAAREYGWTDVPLMCAQELHVHGAMTRVIRVMIHVNTSQTRQHLAHIYLRGTESLRDTAPDDHRDSTPDDRSDANENGKRCP